jgi:hypothetical protein
MQSAIYVICQVITYLQSILTISILQRNDLVTLVLGGVLVKFVINTLHSFH